MGSIGVDGAKEPVGSLGLSAASSVRQLCAVPRETPRAELRLLTLSPLFAMTCFP